MGIKPIRKVNVGEQVFQQLKKLLIEGEWKQGDKLPSENELSEMFGVSRITVRQALQKLVALGLIETRLGEGSFVKKLEPADAMNGLIPAAYLRKEAIFEVLEFREAIEAESARLAAGRASKADIQELEIILQKMEETKEKDDLKAFALADYEFHYKIGQITKNDLIIRTNNILGEVLKSSMIEIVGKVGFKPGVYYHRKIIDAIAQQDGDLALKLMREHIGNNAQYF